jgi:hypothetical protein
VQFQVQSSAQVQDRDAQMTTERLCVPVYVLGEAARAHKMDRPADENAPQHRPESRRQRSARLSPRLAFLRGSRHQARHTQGL